MRIRRFFHAFLAIIALGIVWQMVSTWNRTTPVIPAESARARPQTPDRPAMALSARSIQTGQRLAQQTTDKDLFSPDRKRPVVVQQVASTEPPPPPSHLTLVGVLLTPGREEAFLANSSQGNRVTRVQKGEEVDRYRLTRLTASEATLSLGDDGGEVALPLALLSSKKAKDLPRLAPKKVAVPQQADQGQNPALGASGEDPLQIQDDIQQLRRHLRRLRRQTRRVERRMEAAETLEEEEVE